MHKHPMFVQKNGFTGLVLLTFKALYLVAFGKVITFAIRKLH